MLNRKKDERKPVDPMQSEAAALKAAQAERDRELNERREAAKKQKARDAQMRQITKEHRKNKAGAEETFNYSNGEKIYTVHVTGEQRDLLKAGQLGVVNWGGEYHILAAESCLKVQNISPKTFVFLNDIVKSKDDAAVDKDDPNADHYSQFEIPDDLDW